MKIFAVLLFVLLAFEVAQAAVGQEGPHKDRKPNGCYNEKLGHLKDQEVKKNPNECSVAKCDGKSGSIYYEGCGTVGVPANCKQEYDLSLPHPQCCTPKITCN